MPWMTPLSASISGSTTIATAVELLLGRHRAGFRIGDGILRRLDHDCRCRNRFALRLRSPFNFRDGGLQRDHQDDPGGATDPERHAAKRFNLDFAVQEVLRQKGRARDDVRLGYRFERLPGLLRQQPLEHARRQLAKCFIDRGENRKGPLILEHLNHARGLKQVQEAVNRPSCCAVWMMSAACAVQAPSDSGTASATAFGSAA